MEPTPTLVIPDKPFKLELPPKGGFSVVMIGASRSGKTTAMKHIVEKYMGDKMIFFTSFNAHHDIYKDMPKKTMVCSDFYPEILKDFHILQKESKNKYKGLFIFDDAIGHQLKNHPQITKLFSIYRNSDMCGIFSAQAPTLISPVGRANANYVMLFRLGNAGDIENTVKDFLRGWLPKTMSMNERIIWYQQATADHNFILIDNLNSVVCRCKLSPEQVK